MTTTTNARARRLSQWVSAHRAWQRRGGSPPPPPDVDDIAGVLDDLRDAMAAMTERWGVRTDATPPPIGWTVARTAPDGDLENDWNGTIHRDQAVAEEECRLANEPGSTPPGIGPWRVLGIIDAHSTDPAGCPPEPAPEVSR